MQNGTETFVQGQNVTAAWVNTVVLTSLTLSMAVNTLMTGLIVVKILKVFLEVEATVTSVERTLGLTGGTKLRHIIFIIIESGMTLFAIQLVRIVLLAVPSSSDTFDYVYLLVVSIHQMFNVSSFLLLLFY